LARLAVVVALVLALPACARRAGVLPASRTAASGASEPWHLRLELDSAPGRTPKRWQAEGVVAPDFSRYDLDVASLIGRSLTPAAEFSVIKQTDTPDGTWIEITLGDAKSDHSKILLRGRPARTGAADSIVGTWVEQAYCCSAAGRFTLWRPGR
jgi:hypothetical protein